jgi:N-acetylglucosaminyl-diphospho-decaprenol L-rhamnosyltransferase
MSGLDQTPPRTATARSKTAAGLETRLGLDIAVIIVTYKTAKLTVECLCSVDAERTAAGPLRIRAIVVDNASGDLPAVAEAVEKNDWSSWVTLVETPENGGFAYGNNVGFKRACAEVMPDYLLLLNPDTQVRPGAVRVLVDFLEAHPEIGIAGGSFENLDGSDGPISFRFPSLLSELEGGLQFSLATRLLRRWVVARPMSRTNQPVDWICGASMMIRPKVFASVGGFDENYFLYFEETDFCRRASEAGFATWYVPESRVMHIMGQSTTVTDAKNAFKRLPSFWFESRRRYFAVSFGIWRAAAIDIVAILAYSLGALKRRILGRAHAEIPYFIRDLVRNSVLWPRNRGIAAARSNAVDARQ